MRNRTLEIDQQVGQLDHLHHHPEEIHVRIVVALREIAHGHVVGYEHIDALEDGAVLDDGFAAAGDFHHVLETLREEIDLQIERPALDVLVIVFQERVVGHSLEFRGPAVVLGEHPGQRGLAAADIAGDSDVHLRKDLSG